MKTKTNHDLYAARIKFPDYVVARMHAVRLGATDTVSLGRHGLVGIVDDLRHLRTSD